MELNKFSCPNCNNKLQLKNIWFLSNKTVIICNNCNSNLMPVKMSEYYFIISFLTTALPGFFFAKYYHSLFRGLLIGFFFGLITYLISIIYTYFTVRFEKI